MQQCRSLSGMQSRSFQGVSITAAGAPQQEGGFAVGKDGEREHYQLPRQGEPFGGSGVSLWQTTISVENSSQDLHRNSFPASSHTAA